jgi:hypothetical protein
MGPIRWKEFEYSHTAKTANWFWLVASGALAFIIIAILMHNFLFGFFAIAAAFAVILMGVKKPRELTFSIEAKGIKIGPRLYLYEDLNSFWINYDPPEKKELILETKKKLAQHIKIPLGDTNPN